MRRPSRPILPAVVLATLAALSVATPAAANGRFPYATQYVLHPRRPEVALLRSTFGLLETDDGGKTYHWICEEAALLPADLPFDPGVALFQDGRMVVGTLTGLTSSSDRGCNFGEDPTLRNRYVVDLTVLGNDPTKGYALTAVRGQGGEPPDVANRVYVTTDQGASWQPRGAPLRADVAPSTIDVAPSDAMRLYVAGGRAGAGKLASFVASSKDAGDTWEYLEVPDVLSLFVAGVDPTNPDVAYFRSFTGVRSSELYVTPDGGKTVRSVLKQDGAIEAFAVSPDGKRVAVGGPSTGTRVAGRDDLLARGAAAFEAHSPEPVSCLAWTGDGLFGCGTLSVTSRRFVLASSSDEARTWKPMLASLADIAAPREACAADSLNATTCRPRWPALQDVFFNRPRDAGAPARIDAGTDAGGGLPAAPTGSNCDCVVVNGGTTHQRNWTAMALSALLAGIRIARRRRRK